MTVAAIQLDGVTKRFGALTANDSISLSIPAGGIFAIVGENGAGKSTLMNVLYGLLAPDAGTIRVDGRPVSFAGPRDAIAAGIGMVHQHFRLVGPLTVAENVWLGDEPRRGLRHDAREGERKLAALAAEVGFAVDPAARVEDLAVGEQQRVEILKSLSRGARILILDEPTAVLTPQESDDLFAVLRRLAASGRTIVFISHKLGEVMALSERVAVMRGGRLVTVVETAKTSARELATAMVGRELAQSLPRASREPGEIVLQMADVGALSDRGLPALRDVALEVRAGEILGIAGVEGNGQSELFEAIAGHRPASGRIRRPSALAHVPGDRLRHGAVPAMTVAENLILGRQREAAFAARGSLSPAKVRAHAERALQEFDVRPRAPDLPFRSLSGGNQQKAVLARELGKRPQLLLAAHPTRGVDVGAIEAIHARLLAERDRGTAILLVSADLAEILALSDRVAVLYGGRIVHRVSAKDTSERALGPWMTGAGA